MLHVFCYHRITEEPVAHDHWGLTVSRARFEEQLQALSQRMSLLNLARMDLEEAMRSPGDHALISFDDIYREVIDLALPVLEAFEATALLFVAGSFLDRSSFWWDQLENLHVAQPPEEREERIASLWAWLRDLPLEEKELALAHMRRVGRPEPLPPQQRPLRLEELEGISRRAHVRFGGHTMSHPWLPSLTPAAMEEEIRTGHALLAAHTGQEPIAFAYPYGAWDGPSRSAVAACGYRIAFTTQPPSPSEAEVQGQDPLTFPRLCVGNWSGEDLINRLA
jgi:peptidoglycan/xylan/chitin deacetylase (PgdA/CDA1 family)